MASNKFKFVSPGVFIKEIDQSQVARQPEDIGPVVIGRALKGPMMRPVKVNTYAEFEELFGAPIPGASNGDVWREGNKLAPTYGAYAAEAYLANAGPLTYVRLGGVNAEDENAGWDVGAPHATDYSQNAGAYGLFVASCDPVTGVISGDAHLAAVIYTKGGTVGLLGEATDGSPITKAAKTGARWVKYDAAGSLKFKLLFSKDSAATTYDKTKIVNFNKNSKQYIRNILNTDPTKVTSDYTTVGNTEMYFLGQTFENTIAEAFDGSGCYAAVILGLQTTTGKNAGNVKKEAQKASTGWVISQHTEAPATWDALSEAALSGDDITGVKKLFKIHTLAEDEWTQKNIKISIQDIKLPANKFTKSGTFSVVVRAMNDVDDQINVLERFDQCNLDPSSPNYIAKKIGDIYTEWDEAEKRYKEYGQYENLSKYIRVEMDRTIDASGGGNLLPFGFYGPKKFKDVVSAGIAQADTSVVNTNSILYANFANARPGGGPWSANVVDVTYKLPTLPTVASNDKTKYYLRDPKAIYWGLKTTESESKKFNKDVQEYIRTLPADMDNNTEYLQHSFIFSLDDIKGTLSGDNIVAAAWVPNSRTTDSFTKHFEESENLAAFLEQINKFSLPLEGGFEGLDILQKEPFNNRMLDSDADEQTSYEYASILRALYTVADPEVVEMNALVVPGLKNTKLHNKMLSICETRGDSLAILDLDGDYTAVTDLDSSDTIQETKPVVSKAVNYVKDTLVANSSYGCSYFPWVLTADNRDGNKVWIPPSVIALGTFGSTKRFSEVWFAPAGFTRGGLSQNNAGGLPVLQVAQKLNSKERDALYEANINPIASFPAEGIVIFGQKTLQATPSALDRINVRRLMNYVKKEISRMAATVLFDQNVEVTWLRFLGMVEPFLAEVKSGLGLTEFKVVLDETTTTPELVDRNILYAKIFLKPARAIEYIALDFTITNSGASFAD